MDFYYLKDLELNKPNTFWQADLGSEDALPASCLFEGHLYCVGEEGELVSNYYKLTETHLYKYSVESEGHEKAAINWKHLVPVDCEDALYKGFMLKSGDISESFWTDNDIHYDRWREALSKSCILLDLPSTYSIGKQIGTGESGDVFEGNDLKTGQKVAVKFIAKDSLSFTCPQEIELLRRLKHEFIIKLLAVYDYRNTVAMVFEYAQGKTLTKYMERHKRVKESLAKQFMQRLLTVIEYCHSQNCIHRDLKLDNILLSDADDLLSFKLADFGLACELTSFTTSELSCGSAGYMAPELLSNSTLSCKVDVFSAGVIGHAILTGNMPFGGSSELNVLLANLHCSVDINTINWGHTSSLCKAFILTLMAKDPSNRPTASDALKHPWLHLLPDAACPASILKINQAQAISSINSPVCYGESRSKPLLKLDFGHLDRTETEQIPRRVSPTLMRAKDRTRGSQVRQRAIIDSAGLSSQAIYNKTRKLCFTEMARLLALKEREVQKLTSVSH
mmetsp:Transcript_21483/g.39312  ORF Transcript_21483/g.39312 Transcript_21483/m.39312 type:complete len:506 (-) Transcript_21483:58-1575(-)